MRIGMFAEFLKHRSMHIQDDYSVSTSEERKYKTNIPFYFLVYLAIVSLSFSFLPRRRRPHRPVHIEMAGPANSPPCH
jgi:hypothetical protein